MKKFMLSFLNCSLKAKITLLFILVATALGAKEPKFPFVCPGGWFLSESDNSGNATSFVEGATITMVKGNFREGYPLRL
ncbi:MAG TPA: hypothetical protein VGG71_13980, partial [Chitinophagaceae bacterium]